MTPLNDPRTKKLAITIALCGTALITDRFVLGPPTEAAASADAAAVASAASGSVAAAGGAGGVLAAPERTVDPRRVLADRLREVSGGGMAADAEDPLPRVFQARPSWEEGDDPAPAPVVSAAVTEPEARRRERFRQQTRITGVMHSAEGGGAWINGAFVPIGGVIDGFTLVATGPRSVTFDGGGEPLELLMGGPMDAARGPRPGPTGGEPPAAGGGRPASPPAAAGPAESRPVTGSRAG